MIVYVNKIDGKDLYTNKASIKAIEKYLALQSVDGKPKNEVEILKTQTITLNCLASDYIKVANKEFIKLDRCSLRKVLLR